MGQLERKDIISDDAIQAPMILTKALEAVLVAQDNIISKSKQMSDALGNGGSTEKVKKGIQDLTAEQKEQLKVMDAISKESAKNTDSYRASQLALQKLKDENKQALATQDSWTKSMTAANSSLTQLEQALNKNRTAYAALRTEQERNSKSGKDLLGVIQNQDKGVKAIRDSMGQAQGHVGAYREEIEKLIPALKSIAPEAVEAGEATASFGTKLLTIIASPITLGLAGLAAGFFLVKTALESFFERSVEGEDVAAKSAGDWAAAIEVVKDKFADLGKSISNALGLQDHAVAGFIFVTLNQLGLNNLAADYIKKAVETAELTDKQIEQRKEELSIGIEIAEQEKRKAKDLFDSRDKIRKSDQDRFDAALDQRKAIEKEIQLKLKQNDLEQEIAKGEIKVGADNYEAEQKLSNLKEKRIHIESELFQGQRRASQTINTITQETSQREIDTEKAAQDAIIKFRENTYKDIIDINKRIIGNQEFTAEQQIQAAQQSSEAMVGLATVAASKELATAKEAAIKRIQLTSDEQDKIFEESGGNVIKLVELERELKESKLKEDKEYQSQNSAINEQALSDKEKAARDEREAIGKIIIDNGKYWLELRKRLAVEDFNSGMTALNTKFNSGSIGVVAYEKQKLELQKQSSTRIIDIELAEYKTQIDNLMTYQAVTGMLTAEQYKTLQDLQKQFSDTEVKQTQLTADQKVALYKKAKQETIKIVSDLSNAIQGLGDAQYQAAVAASQARIDLLTSEHEQSVKAAGDNKNAIATLDRKYTKELAAETEKQNAIKRKQAKFDKIASEFKVISSTAAGIAQAYEEFPYPVATVFAVLIGAVAALQLAAIAAAPLPSYEIGTSNHPGGPAIVGHGMELVREPGRRPFIVSSPEILNLARGTEVLTNDETMSALAMSAVTRSATGERQIQPIIVDTKSIIDALYKTRQPDLIEQNGEILKAYVKRDGSRQVTRSKWTY